MSSTYLEDQAGEGSCELGFIAPSKWVKWAVDDWGGTDSALFVGDHIRIISFLPCIVTFLGGTRNAIDTGIGRIPRRMSQLLYLRQSGNRDLLTT